ncbi:hypothetical protein K7472_01165 [Streptomyces sp. PTM05]|uniref:Uncharacterized protein n=1 Tax=Streptantibioticus parmotrematis TaxID=2873249 RepID=A0ABS7QNR2_9ACTN|nr:hypothetical protein [Streptantibioticus parmotrematis]MBY8883454.1 hypothetical protein [Streptantibioticus parmotrematis]
MATDTNVHHVDVKLAGCSAKDARVVFGALAEHFTTEQGPGEVTEAHEGERPVIRYAHYDTSECRPSQGPKRISGEVSAYLSGQPTAVREARGALMGDFAAEDRGSSLGDQEMEQVLCLTSGPERTSGGQGKR